MTTKTIRDSQDCCIPIVSERGNGLLKASALLLDQANMLASYSSLAQQPSPGTHLNNSHIKPEHKPTSLLIRQYENRRYYSKLRATYRHIPHSLLQLGNYLLAERQVAKKMKVACLLRYPAHLTYLAYAARTISPSSCELLLSTSSVAVPLRLQSAKYGVTVRSPPLLGVSTATTKGDFPS